MIAINSGQPGVASVEDYSIRRPCGIAAMDVSDLVSGKLETDEEKQHFIPFIACGDRESMDATLRRIVISTREITQKDHKNCGLWISMRLLHGDFRQGEYCIVYGTRKRSKKILNSTWECYKLTNRKRISCNYVGRDSQRFKKVVQEFIQEYFRIS